MKLTVNGEERALASEQLSIAGLLEYERVEMPEMVSVQLNGEFVKREEFDGTGLHEGDAVDFLYFMGGGSSR